MSDHDLRSLLRAAVAGDPEAVRRLDVALARLDPAPDRETVWHPAYDHRPKKPGDPNYGIHGVEIWFIARVPGGGAWLTVFTGWDLESVRQERNQERSASLVGAMTYYDTRMATAADITVCSARKIEGSSESPDCRVTRGSCWQAFTGALVAQPHFERLISEGPEAMWQGLEAFAKKILAEA